MLRAPLLDQLSSLIVPLSLFLSHFLCVSLSTLSQSLFLSLPLSHSISTSTSLSHSISTSTSLSLYFYLNLSLSLNFYVSLSFYLYLSLTLFLFLPLSLTLFLPLPLSLTLYLPLPLYLYLSPRLCHFSLDVSASHSSKHFIFLNYHYHFSTSQLHQFNNTIEIQDFCITALLPNLMEGV